MDTVLRLGAINLDGQDLVVAKSVLRLRDNQWVWSEATQGADLWLVDVDREGYAAQVAELDQQRLVALAMQAAAAERFAHWLAKPLKAMQLMRLLDSLVKVLLPATTSSSSVSAVPMSAADAALSKAEIAAPAAELGDVHPWHGRRLRLAKSPNLARFPVSAEMLPWLDALRHAPVAYEELLAALPMDAEMIDAVLNDAAKAGNLRDTEGNELPPLPKTARGGFWQRLRK